MDTRLDLMVVDDRHLYRVGAKLAHAGPGMDLAELLTIAQDLHVKNVWVVSGTRISQECSVPGEWPGWNITPTYASATTKDSYSYLSARRNEQRHEDHVEVGFPEFSRWPWKTSSGTARGLLATVAYLEDALALPLAWTPAHMSLECLRKQNEARWSWLEPMTLDIEEGPESVGRLRYTDVARELHWPPKGVEIPPPAEATHYIRVDGNSAYGAGMTGLNVGEGNPCWCAPGPLVDFVPPGIYDGKKPGIWSVECFEPKESVWDGKQLPRFDDRTWMTTDLIEQLRRSGHKIIVKMGWYWPVYHQTLRSTAERLWDLRMTWRVLSSKSGTHEAVYESLRVILKAIHGRLARQDNSPHFRRRDVWALVVARSVAMTIYRIEKIHREYGIWPVGIKADELKYAVSDPRIFDAMLDQNKLGGFKLVSVEEIVVRQDVSHLRK
jgi:hypothetical protein